MEMGMGKVATMRPEFRDPQQGPRQLHLFSEVILLDKSNSNTRPLIFQLRDELSPSLANFDRLQNFTGCFEDAFVFAGDMLEIHMEKKTVTLTNGTTYSYGRLITATTDRDSLEISTLLHALKNALLLETLRIEQIMPTDEPGAIRSTQFKKDTTHSYTLKMPVDENRDEIEKIVHPCIDSNGAPHSSPDIPSSNKTLCQVQL